MAAHEESYKGFCLAAMIHRNRLRNILRLLGEIDIAPRGTLADFGCSNGYIISRMQEMPFAQKPWRFLGFDHNRNLLLSAEQRGLENAEFHFIDLNKVSTQWTNAFDVVTCFETLEHTGDYRNAMMNLYCSCKKGGILVLSIPNETGLAGLAKHLGRRLLRRNASGDFFEGKSEWRYIAYLVSGRPIDGFRRPARTGWGPHLGFDWRTYDKFLDEAFVRPGKIKVVSVRKTFANTNRLYLLEKLR